MFENLTEKQKKQVLSSMCILIDNREKKNDHILDYLDGKGIHYKMKKLNCGDYSFYIPKDLDLSIPEDISFEKDVAVERKNSVDELVGNFASDKDRLEREFIRHNGKMVLMVEDEEFYRKLQQGEYRSEINNKSAVGIFHSLMDRYNIQPYFVSKKFAGQFIYYHLYYYLRNRIKEDNVGSKRRKKV